MPHTSGHTTHYRKFIILTAPRCGSNHLSCLLHSHPELVSVGEAFCLEKVWGSPAKPQLDSGWFWKPIRDLFPRLFLRAMIYHAYPGGVRAVGFRMFYHHLDHFGSIREMLGLDRSVAVIHLKRRNMMENLVSLTVARKTGHWSSQTAPAVRPERVRLTFSECTAHFAYLTAKQAEYDAVFSGHPKLTVYYEDLVRHPGRETARIEDFLGVSHRVLTSPLVKQSAYPLPRTVKNYRELKHRFAKTEWSAFFR